MGKNQKFVVLDIETTGLDPKKDKIIEIAAVKLQRGLIVAEFNTLINPQRRISREITQLTGIDNSLVADAPVLSEIIPDLTDFIDSAIIIAHNAPFDSSFLKDYLPEDIKWLDSLALAEIIFPCQNSYSLAALAESLDLPKDGAHRALADTRVTAELFKKCLYKLNSFDNHLKAALNQIASKGQSPLCEFLAAKTKDHNLPENSSFPVFSLPAPLSHSPKEAGGEREIDDQYKLDISEIASYFQPEGYYEQRLEGFENRPQQLKLAEGVAEALNHKQFLLAEAGTGIGKSLAYLLPSALFALNSGNRVAVSTHTINLQEQLLNKDIPMLEKILNRPVKAAVLKGRSNYLCLSLYKSYIRHGSEDFLPFLMRLTVWLGYTKSGEISQLPLNNHDKWKWKLVSAAKENCLAPFCRYCNGECFVQRSRRAADGADIFILNHSLLLANASLERGFLPPLPYLIIDEAHHLEKTAESQFSQGVSFYELLGHLSRLERQEKGHKTGLLQSIAREARAYYDGEFTQESLEGAILKIQENIEAAANGGGEFFRHLQRAYSEAASLGGYFPATIRLDSNLREEEVWFSAENIGLKLVEAINNLALLLIKLWEGLCLSEERQEERMEAKDQLKGISGRLRMLADTLSAIFESQEEDFVVWLEFSSLDKYPCLQMAPLAIGESLYSSVFREKEGVILTSATLTAEKSSFEFYKNQTGLDLLEEAPKELILDSPFRYKNQALLAVCNDLPDPSSNSDIYFTDEVGKALLSLVKASGGRAVVLFTSHAQLRAVYKKLKQPLAKEGITLLAHGINGSPSNLLERLRREENCCILGANSFWEGIDVVGSALSLVIMVRLPFWPPNTPIMQAKLEKMEAMGINSFRNHSLPQAIIRFKQGFGRLIRSKEDIGVFCLLDCRFFTKSYGVHFQKALPEMENFWGSSGDVADKIRNWLA